MNRVILLVLTATVVIAWCGVVEASDQNVSSFTFSYVWGSIEFPEVIRPYETGHCNLTVGAFIEVNIYNLTLVVSGLVGEEWIVLNSLPIARSLSQGENFTEYVRIVLPPNASETLHYSLDLSTDKGFGSLDFYATQVGDYTYEELLNLYGQLTIDNSRLQENFTQLSQNYENLDLAFQSVGNQLNNTQTILSELNSTYGMLNASYSSLEQDYVYLKDKYDSSMNELNIVRYAMFSFVIVTVILLAATVYFRKKAPYVVVRKEMAIKPDDKS